MMTRCVGQACSEFSHKRQELVIKSFRQLGLSLPINGSSDGEISIKELETPPLMNAICAWKSHGMPEAVDLSSDQSSESDEELNLFAGNLLPEYLPTSLPTLSSLPTISSLPTLSSLPMLSSLDT